MAKPQEAVDCWILNEGELEKWLKESKPFEPPNLFPYAYFQRINKRNDDTMEGYLGRRDMHVSYHDRILTGTYEYFGSYSVGKKIGITFDKVTYYEITEIFTSNPLLFTLKRIRRQVYNDVNSNKSQISDTHISKTVHPIHFYDLGGTDFERLVFAYVARMRQWDSIQWLGQSGNDGGRDIWGVENNITFCYQCANYQSLPLKKITHDIDKFVKGNLIPDHFIVVCGGRIPTKMRDVITAYAIRYGVKYLDVWTGAEFEEKLRIDAPELLSRFFVGEVFPK